jgi:hypothetical protein
VSADVERVDVHQVVLSDRTLDLSLIYLLLLVQDPMVFFSRDSLRIYLAEVANQCVAKKQRCPAVAEALFPQGIDEDWFVDR